MTQSKDEYTINLDELGLGGLMEDDTITINLDDTYGATTTYWSNDTITVSDPTFTVGIDMADTIDVNWIWNNMNIDPDEVERMCKEYPSLEKVWRNFKSVYDMVKQDYQGKKDAGEIDDDIPF